MFEDFLAFFNEDLKIESSKDEYSTFISMLGGKMFGEGLFCSFAQNNVNKWIAIVTRAYPDFAQKFKLFGHDWLGRCFGIDLRDETFENVLMFEIGTNEVLEIPCKLEDFLNEEIPLYSDACLAESFFHNWLNQSQEKLKYGRCVGYKVPLFLGGNDDIDNLENSDMEVYWEILTQVKNSIKKGLQKLFFYE